MRLRLTLAALLCAPVWAQSVITTVAGSDYVFDGDGKAATAAAIGQVFGIALDPTGRLFTSASTHNLLFRFTPGGTLRTVAGNGIKGFSGESAIATSAALSYPTGLAAGPDGSIYIADFENHRVRRLRTDGTIETVAGSIDAIGIGDEGPAALASIYLPSAVALDELGRLYITDTGNHRVRIVETDGTIRTFAGTGEPGYSGDGGQASGAAITSPQGVAIDAAGNVYFSDTGTHTLRRVALDGVITTIAGTGSAGFGGDGGPAANAHLNEPRGIAIDAAGRIYIADSFNHRLRRINTDGSIVTVAGTGQPGFSGDGGLAAQALLNEVTGVAPAADGTVYIADFGNSRIRRITSDGRISTVAGNGLARFSGDDAPAVTAALDSPQGVGAAPDGSILIADSFNHRIRRVSAAGVISTIAGGGTAGFSGDGGPATQAGLTHPQGAVVQARDGSIYFSDRKNNRVRAIGPDGRIRTIAGNGAAGFSGDGGPATLAALNFPIDVEVDAAGNLYIAEFQNNRIRRVRPDGVIETVAGNGEAGFSGDGGPARDARLQNPTGITVGADGSLIVCDFENARVRRIGADGIINTIAGNGEKAFTGDGIATETGINLPYKAIFDREGRLLIVERFSGRIRRLNADGNLETIAGNSATRFAGDGGSPLDASFNLPAGLALRATGELLIADSGNNRIRALLPSPPAWTLSRATLALTARSNGVTAAETATATSTIPGVRFTARAETTTGGNWLTVTAPASFLTQTLRIAADPRGLAPGVYRGRVIIETPSAVPAQAAIDVAFTVTEPQGPSLEIAPGELLFTVSEGQSAQQLLLLRNRAAEPVPFTVQTDGAWMRAESANGVAAPAEPQPIVLRADPAGLTQGEYRASLRVVNQQTGESAALPVRMVVTPSRPALRLGLNGLSFQAMEGPDAADIPQKIGVLNTGTGSMPWTAATVEDAGPVRWLTLSGASGVSESEGQTVPEITAGVKAGGLAVGEYRARIRVSAPAAGNPVEFIEVVLNVIPKGATPRPMLTRTGLIAVAAQGGAAPASLATGILNLQQRKLEFRSIRGTFDGGNWFVHRPADGSLDPLQSAGITVQPDPAGLAAGVYEGVITFMFQNQDPRNVKLLMLVTPRPVDPKSAGRMAAACDPASLQMVFTQLAAGFVVKPGQPVALEVQAADNCGAPLRDGLVLATFDDGAPPVPLTALKDGRWSGAWTPAAGPDRPVTVRVFAVAAAPGRARNEITVTGRTGSDVQR